MKEETTVDSAQRGLRLKPANCNAENQRFTKPTKTHKHAPQYSQQSSFFRFAIRFELWRQERLKYLAAIGAWQAEMAALLAEWRPIFQPSAPVEFVISHRVVMEINPMNKQEEAGEKKNRPPAEYLGCYANEPPQALPPSPWNRLIGGGRVG